MQNPVCGVICGFWIVIFIGSVQKTPAALPRG